MVFLSEFPPPRTPQSEMQALLKEEREANKRLAKKARQKAERRQNRKAKRN